MLKTLAIMSGFLTTTALAAQLFGYEGRNGRDAIQGRDGQSGATTYLDVDGKSHSFSLNGTNGEDASSFGEDGEAASNCYQPRQTEFDLYGANGGSGGDAARGGHGGNGGWVGLFIKSEADLAKLKNISIANRGGLAGRDANYAGRGAPGCRCEYTSWSIRLCTWNLYYIKDSQKQYISSETNRCDQREYPPPPAGQNYYWEFGGYQSRYFTCTDGRFGRDGSHVSGAVAGNYGGVAVFVGATSQTQTNGEIRRSVANIIGKVLTLDGFDQKARTGLHGLLSADSDTADSFDLRRYFKKSFRIDWKPKKSPQESGMAEAQIVAQLNGDKDSPSIKTILPIKLTSKVVEQAGTTVITITHVLNSTDPNKIAACAKNNAKGSYLCQFNDQCIYEDGDCLPK